LADYRIVFFDEIEDPYKVTLMFQLSFFFPPLPSRLQYNREHDDRFTPEFGIFAVTRDGDVAAGHLLMRIKTETKEGGLEIGGVNAVGTRPDYARQGIMTAIMDRSHDYFRERGLEYSLLTSSWRLGAMVMYGRMDYAEISSGHLATKYPNQARTPKPPDVDVRPFTDEDFDAIDRVYNEAVQGSYGLIHRPKHFLKARKFASGGEIKGSDLRIAQQGDRVTGYAHWDVNPRHTESLEIMSLDRESMHALLAEIEQRNPTGAVTILCEGLIGEEVGWLKEAGYTAPVKMYSSTVVKSLKGKTDGAAIRQMYGVDEGRFRLGEWDST
jgi:GNAT superfamily N-acetyltransferase